MNMYNKEGSLVTPSTTSVQAAMSQFQAQFARSNFSVDILDAGGASSWPISYLTYLTMDRNVNGVDCTAIQELLAFAAWVYTNDGYPLFLVAPLACPLTARYTARTGRVRTRRTSTSYRSTPA